MRTHKLGTTRHVPFHHSVHDREVLATPFPYPPPIRVSPKLQQAPQAVLLLDCLGQERVTAELSQHFMKTRIGLEQLPGTNRLDVRMRRQIKMLPPAPLKHRPVNIKR